MKLSKIIIILSLLTYQVTIYAAEFKIATTTENLPKKALIIKHNAKFFKNSSDNIAEEAPFIQLYFLMTPKKNNRVPVLKKYSKQKKQPDGWLEEGSYVEWNTVQMINFEPQHNRERVKIYTTLDCAIKTGIGKSTKGCTLVGEEPHKNQASRLLIPVFERQGGNYHGGFIRVYNNQQQHRSISPHVQLGYDLILVVDSTLSMNKYFRPTMRVLKSFIKTIEYSLKGEIRTPLEIGLLLYRDRKNKYQNCDTEYITRWKQHLTSKIEKVIQSLATAQATKCSTSGIPEAVFDGIYTAIIETKWNKNHFKTILLIGDAPPNYADNPNNFSVSSINKLADEKNIRFLSLKIGSENDTAIKEFKSFAYKRKANLRGKYIHINKASISQFENNLMTTLSNEWQLFQKTLEVTRYGNFSEVTEYELPIITAQLKQAGISHNDREFVKGWVPRWLKGKLAFSEYVFMQKTELKLRIILLDSIITAVEAGITEGAEAFLSSVRQTLAANLKMRTTDIFNSHETLGEILKKANILPFKTELLSFTPIEINTWKPRDYERLNQAISEKIKSLREFSNNPNNSRIFYDVNYLYVPKEYFP